jgi:hypothetical protein
VTAGVILDIGLMALFAPAHWEKGRIIMNGEFSRRDFIRAADVLSMGAIAGAPVWAQSANKPNILWLTSEDNGPALGCYGDTFADTPNIDSIAAKGIIHDRACSAKERIAALPKKAKNATPRTGGYPANLMKKTLADLE